MKDHDEIWLEPNHPEHTDDRTWCQDNVFEPEDYDGKQATRYIRADICNDLENQLLDRQVSDCKIIIGLEERLEAVRDWVKAERDGCPACNDEISDTRCDPYINRGLRCPDCPATNVNELGEIMGSKS